MKPPSGTHNKILNDWSASILLSVSTHCLLHCNMGPRKLQQVASDFSSYRNSKHVKHVCWGIPSHHHDPFPIHSSYQQIQRNIWPIASAPSSLYKTVCATTFHWQRQPFLWTASFWPSQMWGLQDIAVVNPSLHTKQQASHVRCTIPEHIFGRLKKLFKLLWRRQKQPTYRWKLMHLRYYVRSVKPRRFATHWVPPLPSQCVALQELFTSLVPHVPEPLLAASACCSICVFLVATAVAVRVSYPLSFLAVMPNWLGCSQMCKPPTDFRISTAFVQNEPLILACTAAAVHPVPQWKILQLSDNVALPPQTAQDFITCRTSWLVSRQSLFFCKEHFWDLIPLTTALLVLAPLAEIGIC